MTALEKQQALCDRLRETDYAAFGGDKDKAMKEVFGGFFSIIEYIVNTARKKNKLLAEKAAGVDVSDREEMSPEDEKAAYRKLTDALNMLNGLSKELGLEPFADIDMNDRKAVCKFASEYTVEHTFNEHDSI